MTYKGMRKVTVAYEIDGRRYEYATSTEGPLNTNRFQVGDAVTVYVHPSKPKRAVVIWETPPIIA
jgi:hypothetical protein